MLKHIFAMKHILFLLLMVLTTHFSMAQTGNNRSVKTKVPTTRSTEVQAKVQPTNADLTIAEFLKTPQGLSLSAEQKAELSKMPSDTKMSELIANVERSNIKDSKSNGKTDLTIAEFLQTPKGLSLSVEEKAELGKIPSHIKLSELVDESDKQSNGGKGRVQPNTSARSGFYATYTLPSWACCMTYPPRACCTTYDCPNLNLNIGASCDDNNTDTIFDTVQSNCTCVGTPWWYFLH